MHCGPPNQPFGWAMVHPAYPAAPHGLIRECVFIRDGRLFLPRELVCRPVVFRQNDCKYTRGSYHPGRCRRLAPICVVISAICCRIFRYVICMHCVSDAAPGRRSTRSTTRRTRRCLLSTARVVRASGSVVPETSNFRCVIHLFSSLCALYRIQVGPKT